MPLADIASILGVTVSRVSQLHHVGLRTLRVALGRARAA